MRWTPEQVALATAGVVVAPRSGDLNRPQSCRSDPSAPSMNGASIDSRRLAPGALFVAIRAERDGHDFVPAAVEAGAGGLLVESGRMGAFPDEVPTIAVADTGEALLALGRAARERLRGVVVGITGSVGKTSTKDLLAAALSSARRTAASEGSFNNDLGVPLTLANAPDDADVAVVEMGARGPGHILRLCDVARPTLAVVTAVAAAHTEAFGDLDAIAAAKSELVAALPASGTAVLNADDPRVLAMGDRTAARVVRYAVHSVRGGGADVVADMVSLDATLRPRFVVRSPWGDATVRLGARGVHQVGNALAALSVAGILGVPLEEAAGALAAARLSPWRMELCTAPGGAAILNDAYNANPASMAAALAALAALPVDRRIAVLGEMAELGARRGEEHRAIAALAERLGIEVLAVGTDAYGIAPLPGLDEAVVALGPLGPGDAVLVKASRIAGLERLAARLLAP
jgi:UDP-N-acetylmuramoyl-tripeptide--D-alanyl-D-alanine ligase